MYLFTLVVSISPAERKIVFVGMIEPIVTGVERGMSSYKSFEVVVEK